MISPPSGLVLGVGIDLVEVERVREALDRTPRFAERVFTPDEWAYCTSHRDPAPHAAARWAAKEAVLKALGLGIFDGALTDIEVVRDDGPPTLRIGGSLEAAAVDAGVGGWHLSLTHTGATAAAIAIAIAAA